MAKSNISAGIGGNKEKSKTTDKKIAIIRIKTSPMASERVNRTLHLLGLHKKYFCVVRQDSQVLRGMLAKVSPYVTWGEIDDKTLKILEGKKGSGRRFYRLHPPRGGFERKGIKLPFSLGGAYGERGDAINALILRRL
ncbi:MAG: uL30 family ribosomal protein [Candidatus Woesearchaeota archaeon]